MPCDQVVRVIGIRTLRVLAHSREVEAVQVAQLSPARSVDRLSRAPIRNQGVQEIGPRDDRDNGADTYSQSARGREGRLYQGEPRVAAAVRGAGYCNLIFVELQFVKVDDLSYDAAQVGDLGVRVGEINLTPGIAEAARGIAKHRIARVYQSSRDVARAALAPRVAVDEDHQGHPSHAVRNEETDIE